MSTSISLTQLGGMITRLIKSQSRHTSRSAWASRSRKKRSSSALGVRAHKGSCTWSALLQARFQRAQGSQTFLGDLSVIIVADFFQVRHRVLTTAARQHSRQINLLFF